MTRGKRVWFILVGGLVAAALIVVALPTPRYVVMGLVNGEEFYHGRPSSFWAMTMEEGKHDDPAQSIFDRCYAFLGMQVNNPNTDPDFVPVLMELLRHENPHVRVHAAYVLVMSEECLCDEAMAVLKNSNLDQTTRRMIAFKVLMDQVRSIPVIRGSGVRREVPQECLKPKPDEK